jgi:ribosomal protein S18 acetylase RimI-like enzyme
MRAMESSDLTGVVELAVGAELFAPEEAEDLAAMLEDFAHPSDARLGIVETAGREVVGVALARHRDATDRVWELTMIAVTPARRRSGLGGALLRATESHLRDRGARMLWVETSGTAAFAPARAFYRKHGYSEAASVPDYWAEGDDLVVFTRTPAGRS